MKFSTAVGCCPCSWPYLFTLSYISAKKKSKMEEREKPVSLLVNHSEQALLSSSQAESTANSQAAENAETLKSPNMSTDSGFEGENNRPLLLQTNLPSPAEDTIISSWRNDVFHAGELEFDVAELGSPKSPKKSTEDSDFNESPFDKKSVPSVGDIQSESDNDDSDHHCTFHNATPIWCNGEISGWKENYIESCQGTTINGIQLIEELPDDEASGYSGKNCFVPATHCTCNGCGAKCKVSLLVSSESEGWNGVLTSELKDCVVYADINNSTHIGNSDNDEQGEKLDTETDDGSDERNFDGTYSDDTLSAYYVPSAISTTTEDYQLHPPVPPPRGIRPFRLKREGTQSEADADISPASRAYYKSLRSQSEPSQYTTVLKPKAVRPPPPENVDRVEYHSSLESLHSGHIVDVLGQRQDRLSAFRERPRSSLSQSENVHVFFSRSLDTPPLIPPSRNPSDRSIAMITSIVVSPSRGGSRSSSSPHPVLSWNDVNNIVHPEDSSKRLEDVDQSSDTNIASVSKEKVPDSMSQVVEDSNAIIATSPSQTKRHSMPWDLFWNSEATRRPISDYDPNREPIHMTLEEVRSSLQTLTRNDQELTSESSKSVAQDNKPSNKRLLGSYLWQKKNKKVDKSVDHAKRLENQCQRKSFPFSIKTAFTNLFGLKRACSAESRFSPSHSKSHDELSSQSSKSKSSPNTSPFTHRALPPLPSDSSAWQTTLTVEEESWSDECGMSQTYDETRTDICEKRKLDYAASIEKVKDCGWYWGPISGEMAEKLLANEPDGSFVVRDSSDEHYIFSLTFKLNGLVRHVRIEHDHGNFSFGCQQKFRSNTIVDFIENAVAHSRSGRYLFFLHRRPILGPMQVQLLHPVSRFKQVQSLQHLCRFVILKTVRRDLIGTLPLPRRMKDYLNTPHYYSEELAYLSQQGKKCETIADNSSHSIGMSDTTYSQHIVQEASSLSNQTTSEV